MALSAALVVGFNAQPARAADGYSLSSNTIYRVDEETPAVWVESKFSMTNTSPNRQVDGGTRFYYYTGVALPIEANAADLTVQVNGNDVEHTVTPDGRWSRLEVEFNSDLRYGKTAEIDVRYRLEPDPPRAPDTFTRVNPAYVSFPVSAFGDDGAAYVTIDTPASWIVDYVGDDLTSRTEGDRVLYDSSEIDTPLDFGVLLTARRDDPLDPTPVSVGEADFEVRAWPGDTAWRDFAVAHVTDGVPALEQITGTPWPETKQTDVIEASTPYLRGYAGYYYADTDVIEVGEDLDSHTMLHELAHAWFNHDTIAERWLSEGLADEVGARAVAALGDPLPMPSDYDDPATTDAAVDLTLNEWGQPDSGTGDETENYGYQTSFTVLRGLSDEIGESKMAMLLAAVLAGQRAYPDEDGEAPDAGAIDWHEFLDLAEQIGGSTTLVDAYRQYVANDVQLTMLDERATTIESYTELAERGDGWLPPDQVRRRMAQWAFVQADEDIVTASALLDQRDQLATTLETVGLAPSDQIEQLYESTLDMPKVALEFDEHIDAAERIVAADGQLNDQLTQLELTSPTFTQDAYEQEPTGLAAEAEQLAQQSLELVDDHDELVATLAEFELSTPALDPDSFVESPETAIETVAEYQAAADVVVAAHRDRQGAQSLVQRLGKLGSGADDQLEQADQALAAGDTRKAVAAAESTQRRVANWDDRGRTRLIIAGAIVITLLLALLTWRIIARRRKGPNDEPDVESEAEIEPAEL